MVQPNLIHKINITCQRLDTASTLYDPDSQEPIQNSARYADTQLVGQPRWTSQREIDLAGFGPSDRVRGYVLFRYADLDALGFELKKNDRFTLHGRITEEVYVTRLEPMAHYGDTNGASLLKAWFSDRLPAKER